MERYKREHTRFINEINELRAKSLTDIPIKKKNSKELEEFKS